MKVLVLGGTKFLGYNIVRELLSAGHEVVIFNRGITKDEHPPAVRRIHGNRSQRDEFRNAVGDLKTDAVIDLIAYSPKDTELALEVFRGKVKQFIHCSTDAVYGKIAGFPAAEDQPCNPDWDYGRNKLECERLLGNAFEKDGFPVTIIRPPYIYGPRSYGFFNYLERNLRFLDRMAKGKPALVPGSGKALMQPVYCQDVARGFASVLNNGKAIGKTYNMAGKTIVSTNQYIKTLAAALKVEADIVNIPADLLYRIDPSLFSPASNDYWTDHHIFDMKRAESDLGYRPEVDFAEGIAREMAWVKENVEVDKSTPDDIEDKIIAAFRQVHAGLIDDELSRIRKVMNDTA